MALNISYNGYSLQSTNVITKNVEFRTRARRVIEATAIARRIGKKLTNTQITEKTINVSGFIIADNQDLLLSEIDDFHLNMGKEEKALIIEGSRTFTATATEVKMPDRPYNQTIQEFGVEFLVSEGFAKDNQQIAGTTVVSGTQSVTITPTISGNVCNRPLFRFTLPTGPDNSTVTRLDVTNAATGNAVTVSGIWGDGSVIAIDYDNYKVTDDGSVIDFTGAMEDIEPGANSFTLTVSGQNDGTPASIEYNPRYF